MLIKRERKLQRLNGYDYTQNNSYFVTISCDNMASFFSELKNNETHLNEFGNIVKNQWLLLENNYKFVFLDEFIVMPNHFHGILTINNEQKKDLVKSLSQLIGAFKTLSSRDIHKLEILKGLEKSFKWHKSFYDRIIRNDRELNNVRNYIKNNPMKWDIDIQKSPNRINNSKNLEYYEDIISYEK